MLLHVVMLLDVVGRCWIRCRMGSLCTKQTGSSEPSQILVPEHRRQNQLSDAVVSCRQDLQGHPMNATDSQLLQAHLSPVFRCGMAQQLFRCLQLVVLCHVVLCCASWCIVLCCAVVCHNTTQHNTTQHNTTQHNTTQHNTTQQLQRTAQ